MELAVAALLPLDDLFDDRAGVHINPDASLRVFVGACARRGVSNFASFQQQADPGCTVPAALQLKTASAGL